MMNLAGLTSLTEPGVVNPGLMKQSTRSAAVVAGGG